MTIERGKMDCISVIVPVYKGKQYIPQIIGMLEENISAADGNLWVELILINDYAKEALELCNLPQHSNRLSIKIFVNAQNLGIHGSRARGLRHARGEYVLFLDQDDRISRLYVREQIRAIQERDAAVCNGKNKGALIYETFEEQKKALDMQTYLNGINQIVSPGQVLLRKSAIPKLWTNNCLQNNGADDYFLWILMLKAHCRIGMNEKILYLHTATGENTSDDWGQMYASKEDMLVVLEEHKVLTTEETGTLRERIRVLSGDGGIPEHIRKPYRRIELYLNLMDCWMGNLEMGKSPDRYLRTNGVKTVAVYGLGMLGKHLVRELVQAQIEVRCIIDRKKAGTFEGIKIVRQMDEQKDVDMVIVTPVLDYGEIKRELCERCSAEIVSLETILYGIDDELDS